MTSFRLHAAPAIVVAGLAMTWTMGLVTRTFFRRPGREEANPFAVRRPERGRCSFRSRQQDLLLGVHGTHPQMPDPVAGGSDKGHPATIGRQREGHIEFGGKCRAFGCRDREARGGSGRRISGAVCRSHWDTPNEERCGKRRQPQRPFHASRAWRGARGRHWRHVRVGDRAQLEQQIGSRLPPRLAGFFARHRATVRASSGGTSGTVAARGWGSSFRIAPIRSAWLSAVNGAVPAIIS